MKRRRRNPDAVRLGTVVEYGPKKKAARVDGRMMRAKSGKLTGYLADDERHRLVMLRPNEVTGTRVEPEPEGVSPLTMLIGIGLVGGVILLLSRR
jgi:hypothetical protein